MSLGVKVKFTQSEVEGLVSVTSLRTGAALGYQRSAEGAAPAAIVGADGAFEADVVLMAAQAQRLTSSIFIRIALPPMAAKQ